MAEQIDSPFLRAIRRAFSQPSAEQLRLSMQAAAPVPPARVWIVWRRMPFGGARVIELVTANQDRALRMAAAEVYLVADEVDVQDAPGCPGWCPNRDRPA